MKFALFLLFGLNLFAAPDLAPAPDRLNRDPRVNSIYVLFNIEGHPDREKLKEKKRNIVSHLKALIAQNPPTETLLELQRELHLVGRAWRVMDVIDYANFHDAFYNATRHIKLDATKMTDSDWRHMASHPGRIFETSFFKNPNTGALEIPDVTNMSPAELRIWMMNFYLDTLDSSYNEPAKELIDQDHPGRLSPLSHAQEFAKFVSESSFTKVFPEDYQVHDSLLEALSPVQRKGWGLPRAGVVTNLVAAGGAIVVGCAMYIAVAPDVRKFFAGPPASTKAELESRLEGPLSREELQRREEIEAAKIWAGKAPPSLYDGIRDPLRKN